MKQLLKVLIIEDQPMIIEGYQNSLLNLSTSKPELEFQIECAEDCDSAMYKLKSIENHAAYDLVFLGIRLPPSKNLKMLSGEDIGLYIRERFEKTKIIILTMYNDNYRLHNILKTVKPDGLLFKNDITTKEFMEATKAIVSGSPYYSVTILKLIRKQISSDLVLDNLDRQILFLLSEGMKMKDLTNIIPLSTGGVERRKRILKTIFNVNTTDDTKLINAAREMGFI